jgi:hypothetical protein
MCLAGIRGQAGNRQPRQRPGPPSVTTPNRLQQQLITTLPNVTQVTDTTHIKTHEAWLYPGVVIDLLSLPHKGRSTKRYSNVFKRLQPPQSRYPPLIINLAAKSNDYAMKLAQGHAIEIDLNDRSLWCDASVIGE